LCRVHHYFVPNYDAEKMAAKYPLDEGISAIGPDLKTEKHTYNMSAHEALRFLVKNKDK
jgi:hypothetical protein